MTNYEFLNDKRIEYLYVLGKTIKKIDLSINKFFNDRDMKLELLIGVDIPEIKENLDKELTSIINDFNNFDMSDLESLNADEADKLSNRVDTVHKYFEYLVSNIEYLMSKNNKSE